MSLQVLCYLDDILLDDEPIGLADVALSLIRDEQLHGIGFEASTSPLEFISNGRDYLQNVKDTQGLKANTIFRVDMRCADGDEYETIITGKVNYSNYKYKCGAFCSVTVPIESVSCEVILNNRMDQAVNLDNNTTFDGLEALASYNDLAVMLELPPKELDYLTEGYVPDHDEPISYTAVADSALRPTYGRVIAANFNQSELDGAEILGFVNASIISPNILWDERVSNFPHPVQVTGRLKGTITNPDGIPFTRAFIIRGEMDVNNFDFLNPPYETILAPIIVGFGSGFSVNFDIPYSYTWNPVDNGADGIYAFIGIAQGTGVNTVTFDPETFFKAESLKVVPATRASMYLIHETLSRITESITNNCCRVKSAYYGRTDSQPFYFDEDGCGGNRAVTSGLKIRNAPNATFFMSLQDAIKDLQAIDDIGMGVETDPVYPDRYVLRIEDLEYFYQDTEILQTLSIPAAVGTIEGGRIFSTIDIGYKKWETQSNFGADEYNANRTFRTNITAVQNKLDRTSGLVAGEYPIEITRDQQFSDSSDADTHYDNENFIICLTRSPGTYAYYPYGGLIVEQGNIDGPAGIFSPGSSLNYRISPIRNLLRNFRTIMASYPNVTDSDNRIFFTSGVGNLVAKGELSDAAVNPCSLEAVPLQENQDILITVFKDQAAATPLWRNEDLTFDYPLSIADYQRIKTNPYGYVSYQCGNGDVSQGWINQIKWQPFKGIANFTLRKRWVDENVKPFVIPPPDGLRLTWSDISTVPVANASSVSDWNTFFDTASNAIFPFNSVTVVGNEVRLYGATNLSIAINLFAGNSHLLSVIDYTGQLTDTQILAFRDCVNLTNIYAPRLLTIDNETFEGCIGLTNIYLPACTNLGVSVGDDNVYNGIAGNAIKLTIPAALATDGDVVTLQANNTVTLILT